MRLIIAEKPSVGKDIAAIVGAKTTRDGFLQGSDCLVSWCIGHLAELAAPEDYTEAWKGWRLETLPMLPESFQLRVNEARSKQFEIVIRLMKDPRITEVVCATDAGREGQLIFMYVYLLSGCQKPVKRLWISSMTDEAIRQGFAQLKDNSAYEGLYQSARCRAEADWLVGMNATRLFTVKYNHKLTVGRVQTPTLAMIVNRQQAIGRFVPEPFYEIEAACGAFRALWVGEEGTRLSDPVKAQAILDRCAGRTGTVSKLQRKKATAERPLLYDLTELQREANRRYGYTAAQTLEAAQTLYERHKLITYPRTDSRYLTQDMKSKLPELVRAVQTGYAGAAEHCQRLLSQGLNCDKRVINDKKVTDHHAIIVTPNMARVRAAKLDEREKNLLKLVAVRFLVALEARQEYDQTELEFLVEGERFKASGKKVTKPGWKAVEEDLLGKAAAAPEGDEEPEQFIDLKKGDPVTPEALKLLSRTTSPPKPYTEDTLLSAMETAGKAIEDETLREEMKGLGLGTPATRAGIIEKLIKTGYVERKRKNLTATPQGIRLISLVPDKLRLPDLTAEWERRLSEIAAGQSEADSFMAGIRSYVTEIVTEAAASGIDRQAFKQQSLGNCPRCGRPVYENSKSFYCSGYRSTPKCTFSLWKSERFFSDKGKELTAEVAAALLAEGRIRMTGLRKKAGDGVYDATVLLQDTGTYVNFRLSFDDRGPGQASLTR